MAVDDPTGGTATGHLCFLLQKPGVMAGDPLEPAPQKAEPILHPPTTGYHQRSEFPRQEFASSLYFIAVVDV